jgi:hypothetical protein
VAANPFVANAKPNRTERKMDFEALLLRIRISLFI